ncbi:MAG TPA: hypothetical protein VMY88_07080 [Acidimicrobiales bacterium]|nr:hypothetical protein [Acidimicrobiales bacterium]
MNLKQKTLRLGAGLLTVGLLAGACGGDTKEDTTAAAAGSDGSSESAEKGGGDYGKAYKEIRTAYHHMYDTSDALAGAIATQNGFAEEGNKAADTRVVLTRLLGEHALLAANATVQGLSAAPDFAAAAAALDENSVELAKVIGSVYGEEAENEFLKQWRDHIRMFVDYTTATAKDDSAGKEKAVAELGGYVKNFGSFLAGAVGLPEDAVQNSLKEHVGQLAGAIDAAKAGDFAGAYGKVREAYHHMGITAAVLSEAIAKQQGLGDSTTKSAETRSLLGAQLGEHAALASLATAKGLTAAPDFEAVANGLDANSVELSKTIGSVYGDAAANEFLKQWRDHIRMFVDYTTATAKNDSAGQEKAVAELGGYVKNFGSFLAGAVGLPDSAVQDALNMHVGQLKGAVDAFAAASA